MFAMSLLIFAAALPTWATVLIVAAVTLVVGGLIYVVFRWGMKNKAVSQTALSGASAVFSVLESMFKDKPDELDAYDFMKAFGAVTKAGLDALKEKEQGLEFDALRDNMKKRITEVLDSLPQLREEVSDGMINKATDAFFIIVGFVPKVKDISK
jgi:hypothetical protein